MQALSDNLQFEEAAVLRDRILAITKIQSRQDINIPNIEEADIVALHQMAGQACVQVFFLRAGSNYGNRAYYPRHTNDASDEQIMEAFLGQFYANKVPPRLILLSHNVTEVTILTEALIERAGRKVRLQVPVRGHKRNFIKLAQENAKQALSRRLVESTSQRQLLEGMAKRLELDQTPERIEVYDNSHISGNNAVGAMIVSGPDGFLKNAYRKFNIRTVGKGMDHSVGDDYAMMREVLTRRFSRLQSEDPNRLCRFQFRTGLSASR